MEIMVSVFPSLPLFLFLFSQLLSGQHKMSLDWCYKHISANTENWIPTNLKQYRFWSECTPITLVHSLTHTSALKKGKKMLVCKPHQTAPFAVQWHKNKIFGKYVGAVSTWKNKSWNSLWQMLLTGGIIHCCGNQVCELSESIHSTIYLTKLSWNSMIFDFPFHTTVEAGRSYLWVLP